MRLYTIGFAGKTAEQFFGLLIANGVSKLVDIRVHPSGQLAGFASKRDLPYFLSRLVGPECGYVHVLELAPTAEMMHEYRRSDDWATFAGRFEQLMEQREMPSALPTGLLVDGACLLCSEEHADRCHRRLVAERVARLVADTTLVHLG